MAVEGDRLVASWTGLGASGAGWPHAGSGAAGRGDAVRAIDASGCPRSRRTCGPRRLRRQLKRAWVAAHGGTAWSTPWGPASSAAVQSRRARQRPARFDLAR